MARQSFSRYLPWLVTGPAALLVWPVSAWASAGFAALFVLGWVDFKQTKQAVRRNYPLTGRLRYYLEYIRPEIRQYFLEDDEEKLPFSRNQRALVYARSKVENDKRGFGSIKDMYSTGTEWIAHSLQPVQPDPTTFRVQVGAGQCAQPYSLSLLNVSGMSFGALSPNAIKALNRGAALGGRPGACQHGRGRCLRNTGRGAFGQRAAGPRGVEREQRGHAQFMAQHLHRCGIGGAAHDQRGRCIAEEIAQFPGGIGGVERQVDRACLQRGQPGQQRGLRFFDMHGHPVARLHPVRAEQVGDLRDARLRSGIGRHRAIGGDQERGVGGFAAGLQEQRKHVWRSGIGQGALLRGLPPGVAGWLPYGK